MCDNHRPIILLLLLFAAQEPLLNSVAHVNQADIEAENGVVHVISHVLIPSSLASIVG